VEVALFLFICVIDFCIYILMRAISLDFSQQNENRLKTEVKTCFTPLNLKSNLDVPIKVEKHIFKKESEKPMVSCNLICFPCTVTIIIY